MVPSEQFRLQAHKAIKHRPCVRAHWQIPWQVLQRSHRLLDDVALSDRLWLSENSKEIAAEERACRLLEHQIASHACGTCGVIRNRSFFCPRSKTSLSPR